MKLKDLSVPVLVGLYGDLLESGRRRLGTRGANVASAASGRAPRPKKTGKTTFSIWTPAQLGQLIDCVRGDRLFAMWSLFTTTGMRRDEVAGSRWPDIDFDARRVEETQAHVVIEHKLTTPSGRCSRWRAGFSSRPGQAPRSDMNRRRHPHMGGWELGGLASFSSSDLRFRYGW